MMYVYANLINSLLGERDESDITSQINFSFCIVLSTVTFMLGRQRFDRGMVSLKCEVIQDGIGNVCSN